MKHTYLYPIADSEVWLWRAARMDASDLFGGPAVDAAPEEFLLSVTLGEALGSAREVLMKRLKSRDRVCVGRSYVIPGSLCGVAEEREKEASRSLREVTEMTWDAPYLYSHLYSNVLQKLKPEAGRDGRDEWAAIFEFCANNRCTKENGKRTRLIPVWM